VGHGTSELEWSARVRLTPAHHLRVAAENTNLSTKVSVVSNRRMAMRATSGACAS
jgi:hypothetical protein